MFISKFHRIVFSVAFVIYCITAINSKGYYQFDEHYQIIEFADLKMGINTIDDLPWEYNARIRSSFQPYICFVCFKILNAIGITSPYLLSFFLRFLSLLFALTVITIFVQSSKELVYGKYQDIYIALSYLLWFLPFLNIRFSSETWSGLFFLLSIALLNLNIHKSKKTFFLIGLLLGLSFLCRYQSVILIIALGAWGIIVKKEAVNNILIIVSAFVLIFILGIIIDSRFYDELTFTSWNYFNANILEGVASSFGTSPWNYYVDIILFKPFFPIGILIYYSLGLLLYTKPRLQIIWIIFPFLIIHSLIPHKEDRFLFPIINLAPLLLVLGFQESEKFFLKKNHENKLYKLFIQIFISIILFINVAALIVMAFKPAGNGAKALTYYIHNTYKQNPVFLIYETAGNPYRPITYKESFYLESNITFISTDSLLHSDNRSLELDTTNLPILFVIKKDEAKKPSSISIINKYRLSYKMQSIPSWISTLLRYYDRNYNDPPLVLYGN